MRKVEWIDLFLIFLWLITGVGFHYLFAWSIVASILVVVILPVIYWRFRRNVLIKYFIVIAFVGMITLLLSLKPSNDRDWAEEYSVLPRIIIKEHDVTIKGFRNFRWRGIQEFDPIWEERTFDLKKLSRLDLIVEPFKDSEFMAHAMLGFGFEDGKQIIVSVEARRETHETYSLIPGAFRQFELIYLFGDAEDMLKLRAVHRGASIYAYPVKADQDFITRLFLELVTSANALHEKPNFYRSVRDNCTTTLVKHIDRVHREEHIGLRLGTLFPARIGRLLHQMGYMDTTLSYEEAESYFRMDEHMRK